MSDKSETETARLTPAGEQAWSEFLRHVEWPDGFALIFLFSSIPAVVDTFRNRLARVFSTFVSTVQIIAPDSADQLAEEVLAVLRMPEERFEHLHAPLWLEAYQTGKPEWQEARNAMLSRLNEHRDMMRSRLHRPVVIVLPGGYRQHVREVAPDLWSVRNHSNDLDEIGALLTDGDVAVMTGQDAIVSPRLVRNAEAMLEEWNRLSLKAVTGREFLFAGWRAADAALSLSRPEQGLSIAEEVLKRARQMVSNEPMQITLRDLSVSLDNVGDTARRMGNLADAGDAYGESLKISRDLLERYGATPESLRDLSVSLNNVADMARSVGNLADAESAYTESVAILLRLVHAFSDIDEYGEMLRDVEGKLSLLKGKTRDTEG